MSELVKIEDVRKLKYCMTGVRIFCKTHGINIAEFVKNGIPISFLREKQIDNAMLEDVIRVAESRAE